MDSALCCVRAAPPHWVPDAQMLCCSACGTSFGLFLRRHHCRCCGAIFCAACSSFHTPLPGWGIDAPARTCEECHTFEVKQLPLLLAGDIFLKPGDWTGRKNRRYLRLSADQGELIWAPWNDDEGADDSTSKGVPMSQITCVTATKARSRSCNPASSPRLYPSSETAARCELVRLACTPFLTQSAPRSHGKYAPRLCCA
jgi:hypothetical protein